MKNERAIITQELCDHVKLLLAGGATAGKAAEITKAGKATIFRIKAAGYDAEVYKENQLRRKEAEKKTAEEPLSGQLKMELAPAEEKKTENNDQTKMMRFTAAQVEKQIEATKKSLMESTVGLGRAINENAVMSQTTLDKINDALHMLLRAIRKE